MFLHQFGDWSLELIIVLAIGQIPLRSTTATSQFMLLSKKLMGYLCIIVSTYNLHTTHTHTEYQMLINKKNLRYAVLKSLVHLMISIK